MKQFLFILLLASLIGVAAPFQEYTAANGFGGWKALRNCTAVREGKALKLAEIGHDSSIVLEPVAFDPACFNTIRVTYRATGIPAKTRGQIFFRNDKKGAFGAHGYFHMKSLVGDGRLHTISTSLRDLANAADWTEGGTVRSLRIDLMDEAGGTSEIHAITLDFDDSLRYPAAIQDEPDWPDLKPDFSGGLAVHGEPYFQARMLCHPKENPRRAIPANAWQFRKAFTVKGPVSDAFIQAIGDDKAEVFLNGVKIAENADWKTPVAAAVPASLFQDGENVLAVVYRNARSAGGVLAELFYQAADGTPRRLGTDATFRAAVNAAGAEWMRPGFNDRGWAVPLDYPPPPAGPWRVQLRYVDAALDGALKGGTAALTAAAGAIVPVELFFTGTRLPRALPLDIALMDGKGTVRWKEHLVVPTGGILRQDGGHWKAIVRWRAPHFLDDGAYTLELLPTTLKDAAAHTVAVAYQASPRLAKRDAFGVMKTPSGMQFHKNGVPFYMVCGNVCKYFNLPVRFGAAAQNVRVAYTDGWWLDEGSYDFGKFDIMAEALYRSDPGALLLVDINLDLPASFLEKYPDEITRDSRRLLTGGRVEYSFASRSMRERLKTALGAAIAYCESSGFSNRILGYRITGGDTNEWLSWPWSRESLPDYSAPARQGFRDYLARHVQELPADTPIPPEAERMADDGEILLRDMKRHLPSLAYHDYYSLMIAECAADLCNHARKLLGDNRAIGTYYGYTAHITSGYFPAMRGHYALKWFLEHTKGSVNFLMSPQSYRIRRPGQNSADMKPFQTLEEHGVIPIIEDDTRTSNAIAWERFYDSQQQAVNPKQSVDLCSRNLGQAVARLQPLMLYSLCSGVDFDLPELVPVINAALAAGQFAIERKVGRHAEIAVVFSEASPKYVAPNARHNGRSRYLQWYSPDGKAHKNLSDGGYSVLGESTTTQLLACSQIGAAVDYILAEDLASHLGDYKLYIFTDCYAYDDAFLAAVQKLRQRPCTLLWLYAPGLYHGGTASLENMRRLTGLLLEQVPAPILPAIGMDGGFLGLTTLRVSPMFQVQAAPGVTALAPYLEGGGTGLAEVRLGAARSVFCGAYRLPPAFLRRLAKERGVFLHSESSDPMEVNDAFVTLHARTPGKKTIVFPKPCDILDVFTGDILARNATSITIDAPLHSSWLLYYGPEAEPLRLRLLNPCPSAPD